MDNEDKKKLRLALGLAEASAHIKAAKERVSDAHHAYCVGLEMSGGDPTEANDITDEMLRSLQVLDKVSAKLNEPLTEIILL